MCGVVGALLSLYCRSGCRADVVASALTFHPPEPFYDFEEGEDGKLCIMLCEELYYPAFDGVTAHLLHTKNKTRVPVMCFRTPGAKLTVIVSHGNATDCGAMYVFYSMIAEACKVNVVGYDYTGYGASLKYGTRTTERQTYQDIETVYDWCCSAKSCVDGSGTPLVTDPKRQIVMYGQSLGSGTSCFIASRRPVAGLILHSPILSGIRVLTPSRALWCFDIFPNIDFIKKVRCKTFVIHGEEDSEVRVFHGKQLYEAVPPEFQTEPWWVPERGHNDLLQNNEKEFFARLKRFFAEVIADKPPTILAPRTGGWRSSKTTTSTASSLTPSPRPQTGDGDVDHSLLEGGSGLVRADFNDGAQQSTSATTTAANELDDTESVTTILPDTPGKPEPDREGGEDPPPALAQSPESQAADPEGTWQGVQSTRKPIIPRQSLAAYEAVRDERAADSEATTWSGVQSARKGAAVQDQDEDRAGRSLAAIKLTLPVVVERGVGYAGVGVDARNLRGALDKKGK